MNSINFAVNELLQDKELIKVAENELLANDVDFGPYNQEADFIK